MIKLIIFSVVLVSLIFSAHLLIDRYVRVAFIRDVVKMSSGAILTAFACLILFYGQALVHGEFRLGKGLILCPGAICLLHIVETMLFNGYMIFRRAVRSLKIIAAMLLIFKLYTFIADIHNDLSKLQW